MTAIETDVTPELSMRQRAFLAAVYRMSQQRGFPPTLREIGAEMGIRSTGMLSYYRDCLTRLGFITCHYGIARSLLLTPAGRALIEPVENEV